MSNFDPTKPVQTRNGLKARIVATNAAGDYPLIALVKEGPCVELPYSYGPDGQWLSRARGVAHPMDLINSPPKPVERWINVYREDGSEYYSSVLWDSAEKADRNRRTGDHVTSVKIELPPRK